MKKLIHSQGFSLIELITIIIVLAIAAAGVISMNANILSGQDSNTELETGISKMQSCAERILSDRKTNGIASTNLANSTSASALCSSDGLLPTNSVTVTQVNAGTTSGMDAGTCPHADDGDTATTECLLINIRQGTSGPSIKLLLAR